MITDTAREGNTMTENVRKRISKWDVMEETHVPTEVGQDNALPAEAGDFCQEKGLHSDLCSEQEVGNFKITKDCPGRSQSPNWSFLEAGKKDGSKRSNWEPISGNQSALRDGNVSRENDGWGTSLDRAYSSSMSPGLDGLRHHSRSISPKSGWSRSHRSRSRSPPHAFKHRSENFDDRGRMGVGRSAPPCRDFAAGNCRRGSECRYLHEDGGRRNFDRYSDGGSTEIRESRFERSRYSEHDENFTNSREQRGYSQDKFSKRQGSRHDGNWEKHELHRNNRSTERCYDFSMGRCQRGSACRYVHDASSDSGWLTKDDARERTQDRRDPKASIGQRLERPRTNDIPCRYFPLGRCRNGESCRFSHQDVPQVNLEGKLHDHSLETDNRSSRSGPKWGDQTATLNAPNPSQFMGASNFMDRADPRHKLQDSNSQDIVDYGFQISPQETHQTTLSSQEQNVAQHQNVSTVSPQLMAESSYIQQHPVTKGEMFSPEDGVMVTNSTSQTEMNFSAINLPAVAPPGQSFGQSGPSHYIVPQLLHAQSLTPNVQNQQVVAPLISNGPGQQQKVYSLPLNGQNQFIVPPPPRNTQNFNLSGQSQQILPPPFGGQSQQIVHPLAPNEQGQSQYIAPQPPSNQQSFNPDEQSHQMISQQHSNSHHHTPISWEESIPRADKSEIKPSQINSDAPTTQKVVTSEQVAQLTNLSASLAQIFGNGQQLPQLYATLNPLNASGPSPSSPFSNSSSVRPLAPAAAPFIQNNQGSLSQQHYGPIPVGTENVKPDTSNLYLGFSPISVEQKESTVEEPQRTLKDLSPLPVNDGPHDGNPNKGADLVEKLLHGNVDFKQAELSGDTKSKEVNETETGQSKKEQPTAHSEDVDADVRTDGESKSSKDIKGMRMFKFALVEFVKDAIKPAWKEGRLSKEGHNTIVKKVVEKVTGAMHGPNIPQTQEKIDLYLSNSKTKLTKLVQAYVEKYVKS